MGLYINQERLFQRWAKKDEEARFGGVLSLPELTSRCRDTDRIKQDYVQIIHQ
jgi:hypothetical protein